jgi:hypothetical protein
MRKAVGSLLLVVLGVLVVSVVDAGAGWRVRFIPDEVDSMTVLIDGQKVLEWKRAEGDVTKDVPKQWAEASKIHIRGEGSPNGRNAHMQVYYNNVMKKKMTFDNGEDHDLTK